MPQELTSQELTADGSSLNGGGNSTSGFATGSTCTTSGTYRASNKYMDTVAIFAQGDVFLPFVDGKKTTWYLLSPTLSTNKEGSFTSVKVEAGAV
jgi:hypothetical protein